MANRRISDLQSIDSNSLAPEDLLTVVHVSEVDPVIKNRKLTLSGFNEYLSVRYLTSSGGTVSGNLLVSGDLRVSGQLFLNSISATGTADFGEFGLDYKVTATIESLSVTVGKDVIPCGNTLNARAIAAIKNLSKGDMVQINASVITNTGVKPKLVISSSFRINN